MKKPFFGKEGRLLPALLAAAMLAGGCSAREGAAVSSKAAPPQSQSAFTGEASSSAAVPEDLEQETQPPKATMPPGKVLALGDPQRPVFPSTAPVLASEDERQRWETLLGSEEIAYLDAGGMDENEKELTAENAQAVLEILREAELGLYQEPFNPSTGGAEQVYAYDAGGALLFCASYDGAGLSVRFGEEDVYYLFDGEGSALDGLAAIF